MKALVIGASGLVGLHLMQSGHTRGWQMIGTYAAHPEEGLVHFNMSDTSQVSTVLQAQQPDIIFLTAFNGNADDCELHPAETRRNNVEGSMHVIRAAHTMQKIIVFYSTDYVFDGRTGPYTETDKPHPMNDYGRQKLAIEKEMTALHGKQLIIRTTGVFGWEKQEKNFFCHVLRALKHDEDMRVPTDQISTPTFAPDLAEASLSLAERQTAGVFHVAGPELLSRFSFAEAIAEAFDLPKNHLKPATTLALKQLAARPLRGGLLCEKLRQALPAWQSHSITESLHLLRSTYRE